MLKTSAAIPLAGALLSVLAGCGSNEPDPPGAAPAASGSAAGVRGDGPPAPVPPLWEDATESSGVRFVHVAGAEGAWALTEIMGGGGALFDMDDDGDLDLVLLNGASRSADPASPQAGSGHALFRNDGAGRFTDASEGAGLGGLVGYAMGVATGDVNGDGHVDLFVTQHGDDVLLLGDGDGHFADATEAWGAAVPGWSTSAAFADVDADGDLDLFVTRYIVLKPGLECHDSAGRRTYCPPASGPAVHDVLLRNDGGRFTDISEAVGLTETPLPGLGVVAEDLTGDGAVDLYVANDGQVNQLWVRRPDGSWRDEGGLRGVALNKSGNAEASMGVVAEDLDGDGRCDLFMTHLQEETHTLYRAGSRGTFSDRTGAAGLGVLTRPSTGFGVAAFDLELDGDLDLAVAQGRVRIGPVFEGCALTGAWAQLAEPNLLLVNDGSGGFGGAGSAALALTGPVMVDRCVLQGDLDGDGDIDLVMTRNEGPAQVLLNAATRAGTWILVDPRSTAGGATTLGAKVTVRDGEYSFSRTSRASDGYQSSRDPRVHFGVPGAPPEVDVVIQWPDGAVEAFAGRATASVHRLVRGTGETR